MTRWVPLAFVLLLPVAGGCAGEGNRLLVSLRTDYVAQVEFDEVRVFLALPSGSEEVRTHLVGPLDYTRGQRVVTFDGVPTGGQEVRAELTLGNVLVGARTALLSLSQDTSASLIVTRSCAGVMCPDGDDPSATECAGGRCVSPACTLETPTACAGGCAEDRDCEAAVSCGQGQCTVEGSCVFIPIEGACGEGEYCDPTAGCRPNCIGGLCADAGMPPAGSWVAGEFGPCSSSCGPGEQQREVNCVDGSGRTVAASSCAGPPPEATRSCESGSSTCGLGEWSAFGTCDGSCSQTQTRPCNVPGHCAGALEQTRECSGGDCCPVAGATCGPTAYRRSGNWVCREDGGDFNVLFYAPYIFTERRCNSARTCVPQDLARNLECICSTAGPGCTSSTSGCGPVSSRRCRDVGTGTRGACPNEDVYADCF